MLYNKITTTAYHALLSGNFDDFPIELSEFKQDGFYIISYQQYAAVSGITVEQLTSGFQLKDGYFIPSIRGKKLILYNNDISPRRRNFTIAHELGHAFLQHTDDSAEHEAEANLFAAQLLMPDAVIKFLQNNGEKTDLKHLQSLFGVSSAAAQIKLEFINDHLAHTSLDAKITARFSRCLRKTCGSLRAVDRQNDAALLRFENRFIGG